MILSIPLRKTCAHLLHPEGGGEVNNSNKRHPKKWWRPSVFVKGTSVRGNMHQHFLNLDFPVEGWHFLTPLNRRWISRRKKLYKVFMWVNLLFLWLCFQYGQNVKMTKKPTYSYFDICLSDFSPAGAVYKPLYAWLETTSLHRVINCFRQWIFSYLKKKKKIYPSSPKMRLMSTNKW